MLFIFILLAPRVAQMNTFLEKAKNALANKKLVEALSLYDTAIQNDDKNPVAYFLRGSLNELLGRRSQAIEDFTASLALNPSFDKAKLSRSKLYVKQGEFELADADFSSLLKSSNGELLNDVRACAQKVQTLRQKYAEIDRLLQKRRYSEAFDISQTLAEQVSFDVAFRKKRVEMLEHIKNHDTLVSELDFLSRLTPNDLDLSLKIANSYFSRNLLVNSAVHIKRCLKSDPEHSACQKYFKKIKRINKLNSRINEEMGKSDFQGAVKSASALLEVAGEAEHLVVRAKSFLCRANQKLGKTEAALAFCSFVIRADPGDIDALLARAEIYITQEQLEDAKTDYNLVLQKEPHNNEAREGLGRIERLLKKLSRRDYYEILGISRRASIQDIERAYRKLVRTSHPDHFQDPEKIKVANKKLQNLNDARSVLTDPEKRKRFDEGYDPLDPEDQQGSDGNQHFNGDQGSSFFSSFQGQNPFGGNGGFSFTFG